MHPLCVYYILWSARHFALDVVSLQENHKNALDSLENWRGGEGGNLKRSKKEKKKDTERE